MEVVKIPLSQLHPNTGQIQGLPENPRTWTDADVAKLAKSLVETPELFEARPIIATPYRGGYVILGGNMRYHACMMNKADDAPVFVLPEETSIEKMKEIIIKDNGAFGAWNFDAIANEWNDLPMVDWGVPAWEDKQEASSDDFGTDFTLPDGDKEPFRQVSVLCSDEMAEVFLLALRAAQYTEEFFKMHSEESDKTSTGVAAYIIAKGWLDDMQTKFPPKELDDAKKAKEELRAYLCDSLNKSGKKASEIDALLGTNGMAGHYFGASQWMFPTRDAYTKMATVMPLERDYFECKMVEARANMVETLNDKMKIWEDVRK